MSGDVSGDPYAIVQTPLSGRPWLAEVEVTTALATALIELSLIHI